MKYIITESQHDYYRVARRTDLIWKAITLTRPFMYPCDYDEGIFLDTVIGHLGDIVYGTMDPFDDEDLPMVQKVARAFFADKLKERWEFACGD